MVGILNRLKNALSKTSSKISSSIDSLFTKRKLDESTLQELEDILILADTGSKIASDIAQQLRKRKFDKEIDSLQIKQELIDIITTMLEILEHDFLLQENGLTVILVCGVNGNGKTTTIGKMASRFQSQGKKVAIAACDTFRAAAVEQLSSWSERAGAKFFRGSENVDPASVAHLAMVESMANNIDVLFVDTAGRLHNQKNLMDELAKIIRVIKKASPDAPHHSLLVLDATTGQNALTQVEQFKLVANISGVVVTKLDGTAKAGSVLSIVDKFKLPIYFIGVGEKIDDLRNFQAREFATALVGL